MEHQHKKTGWRIVLPDAEQVTQRDLNKYMAAFRDSKLGESVTEMHTKMLQAALKTGLVKAIEPAIAADQVESLPPAQVRWYGQHINTLYVEVTTIPPE